jgi:GDP-mannose 6-dehydrogenase
MRISVFGLGYVGTVTAACLAGEGHDVVGADINRDKIEWINSGQSPIIEERIEGIIADVVGKKQLSATLDSKAAISETDVSLICVGTPAKDDGEVDLSYVSRVTDKIGNILKNKSGFHTLVYRSTVPPGTTEEIIIPQLEETSGKKVYIDFDVCYNPQFLREGSGVADFYDPPFIIVGQQSEQAAQIVARLYSSLSAPVELTTIKTAEMLKYACNSFHALKVCFANEIGTIARRIGVDGYELMRLFRLDEKLNLSGLYLNPGFAYGGPCLPKDIQALLQTAVQADHAVPLLEAIADSNRAQIEYGFRLVSSFKKKKIGLLGLSFKSGTDDLRESPLVLLAKKLIADGAQLLVYDRNVNVSRIFGANRSFIEQEIPDIQRYFGSSIEDVVHNSEVVIVGNRDQEYSEAVRRVKDRILVDFVRIAEDVSGMGGNYRGICW